MSTTNHAAALTKEEIDLAYDEMLKVFGKIGLSAAPARHPLLLAEVASWMSAASVFLSLRDHYRDVNLTDAELDQLVAEMKSYVPIRVDELLASVVMTRDAAKPHSTVDQPSVAAH